MLTVKQARKSSAIGIAIKSLAAQISDNKKLTLTLMSWLGQGALQWPLNSELGDLGNSAPSFGKLFRYLRCDIRLERDWLADRLGADLSPAQVLALRPMENPDNVLPLHELGRQAAATQISRDLLEKW